MWRKMHAKTYYSELDHGQNRPKCYNHNFQLFLVGNYVF